MKLFASKILLLNGKVSRDSFETGRGNENYPFEHGVEKQLQHKFWKMVKDYVQDLESLKATGKQYILGNSVQ